MSESEVAKLQEEVEESALIEKEQKFCLAKVGVGIFKILTWIGTYAYAVFTYFIYDLINKQNGNLIQLLQTPFVIILGFGWTIATVCIILNLQKAISAQIEKMEIKVNAEAKLNKNINVDAAKIVEAVKN